MTAENSGETTCSCGKKNEFTIEKPKAFQPTYAKINCACGSKYMLRCERNKAGYKIFADLIDLHPDAAAGAKESLKEKIDGVPLKNKIQRATKKLGNKLVESIDRSVIKAIDPLMLATHDISRRARKGKRK